MRHKALAVRITELTEDLEELRSEKALLLQRFEYAEDAGAEAFRKDISTMKAGLKKLEAQEQKYSAELDKALDKYAELKAQAADFDPGELYKAHQVIRPAQEKAAALTSRRLYTWAMSSSVVQIVPQEDYCRYHMSFMLC